MLLQRRAERPERGYCVSAEQNVLERDVCFYFQCVTREPALFGDASDETGLSLRLGEAALSLGHHGLTPVRHALVTRISQLESKIQPGSLGAVEFSQDGIGRGLSAKVDG